MAEGGHFSVLDEEECEDEEDFMPGPFVKEFIPAPFMYTVVTELMKQGDENVKAKLHEDALMCYTLALNQQAPPFMDIAIISEKLYRKRAVCYFKMGKYLEAVHDSERAIEIADGTNNKNLAKSLFIKTKAIMSLEDYVAAFPIAVWCKHLRPNCSTTRTVVNDLKEKLKEEFRKDDFMIKVVLLKTLELADEVSIDPKTRGLALDCYNELLHLLDFQILPGVQIRKAECLLQMGRCKEAKDVCAEVLWLRCNDVEALNLMSEITRQIRQKKMKEAREKEKPNIDESESLGENRKNPSTASPLLSEVTQQSMQEIKELSLPVMNNEAKEQSIDLHPTQVGGLQTKEQGSKQKKKKRNKEKKKKRRAKKKAQKKSETSKGLPPVSNDTNSSLDDSPDEDDSQATDSVIEDPDDSLSYLHMNNTTTLTYRHNVSEVDGREESDGEEFTLVQYTRRQPQMRGNEILLDSPRQFEEKVSSLDYIVSTGEKCQSSKNVSIQPIAEKQSLPRGGTAETVKTPITATKVKSTELLSETVMGSQDHKTSVITSTDKVSDLSKKKTEIPNLRNAEDFPSLEREPVKVSVSSSGAAWSNSIAPRVPVRVTTSLNKRPDQSSNMIPIQQGRYFDFLGSPIAEQGQRSPTPASIIQTFQNGRPTITTNTHADQLTGLNNLALIPEKVFVVCGHFLGSWPPCDSAQAKTCQSCEDLSMLKYATWNDIHRQWQVIRQFPAGMIPPTAVLDICKHFATRMSCRREPCTFAHGELERHIWELQRGGRLPTPEESLRMLRSTNAATPAQLITQAKDGNSTAAQAISNRSEYLVTASYRDSIANPSSGFGTVTNPSLPSNTFPGAQFGIPFKSSPISATPAIFASQAALTRIRTDAYVSPTEDSFNTKSPLGSCPMPSAPGQPPLLVQPLPTSTIRIAVAVSTGAEAMENPITHIAPPTDMSPLVKPVEAVSPHNGWSSSSEKSERSSTPIHSSAQKSISISQEFEQNAISTQSFCERGRENSQPSTWSSALKSPGRPSTPIQKTTTILPINSPNDYRRVPNGVYVVCDDFLQKNGKRAASIFDKSKACKGCENRSKLKYAFWSDIWKQWELIRPFPKEVKITVAFKECRQYSKHERCLRIPCLFAHGEQEVTMWTMEREGVLPTPRETLTGSSSGMPSTSAENSAAKQPPVRLLHRPPPPGVTNGSYKLCKSYYTSERCRFGRGCIYAHSQEELNEWKQEYDRKVMENRAMEIKEKDEEFCSEMTSKILEAPPEDRVECLAGVEVTCTPPELSVKLRDKEQHKWTFTLSFKPDEVGSLPNVFLLHRYHSCYRLSEIRVGRIEEKQGCETYKLLYTAKLEDSWYKSPSPKRQVGRVKVALTVSFESPLYGSFEQLVLFDFGRKPYLMKKLNADVTSESTTLPIAPEHLATHTPAIWDERSVEVVRFVHETREAFKAEHLSRKYSLPRQAEIADELLSPKIYKHVMHQLLFVEERFMKEEISRYTLNNAQLHAQWNIFDDMTGMKCAVDGELFGVLHLQEEDALRPDDAAGRLLYRNVNSVWLQLANSGSKTVYEAPVEKVESECVVLRLPSKLCSDLKLHDTCDVAVHAQFQLNRWPLCQLHEAVERLTSGQLRLIFPDPSVGTVISEVKIRWQWLLDKRLNSNQKKVIERIASLEDNALPLVVFGPFGTGKTFTLNQAVRLLVQLDKSHRILLCTHSNRAADIHVELLHGYLTMNGIPAARPLRVYQPMRRLETASEIARKYCLIKDGMFVLPCRDDVVEHRVVITTLSTSQVLLDLEVLHGFFTHILIDEAAQALEPEALNPLKFAGTNTKVVFTGDHMQMSPEVYSPQARSLGLQKSLAERLFDLYEKYEAEAPKRNPNLDEESNVMWLTENYRCNECILKFPSENFYGKKLIARGHESQPKHPKYGPLLFFSARGKEKKEQDNSYLNLSEVYEVEKRVKEIADSWPTVWGPKILSDIAVLSSYRYQVKAIRKRLRQVKDQDLSDVKVDTIHNVQGEEFRVLFISTVRTFHTCKPQQEELRNSGSGGQLYWEFLSDPKLLNTAVTRARCMVAVVGDPVSLCTVGECRGIWRDYIKRCNKAGGLFGTTMEELSREISASIASVQLNPEAKTFIPSFVPKLEKSLGAKAPEKAIEIAQEDVYVRQVIEEQNFRKVVETESDTREASGQRISSEGSAENDALDSKGIPILSLTDQDQDQGEEEPDDDNGDSNDFQDSVLEDETVFPRDMDEIIQAFVQKCEETLKMDEERKSIFDDCEFPSLQAVEGLKKPPIEHAQHPTFKGGADIKDLFPEVRVINGRIEVRLTNLGFYNSPSERAKRIMISSKQQDFLDPSVLMQLIADEPEKYIVCNLRLSPEKSQVGYAEVEDTKTPSIHIKGKLRQAFDRDKVVIELVERKARSKADENEPGVQGRVVGVLEHIISPHERQFVCTTDYANPAVMVPINKAATKLVNLTDKTCEDIPMYRKDHNGRAIKVKMFKKEKVLTGKYLFVVKYLQWKRDFSNPLGIVVRSLSRGHDLRSSMEIAYAEHGVRREFREQTLRYVEDNFPLGWTIPEVERNNRTKVSDAITIDPPTSMDLDDALTIENISRSTFRLGIHIADATFFVRPNTPLDDEAFSRCSSYYPQNGHENVPMLPRQLSENFCSLLPNKDRLAVSVFATINEEGILVDKPEIKRTIVRSCCRLSYAEAQMIIDEKDASTSEISEDIKGKVRRLSSLAQKSRFHRLRDRAFDHWQNEGNDFEAHELVEEWMILANQEIAKLLSQKNSELALLKIQLPPKDHRLAEWIQMYGKYTRMSLTLSATFTKDTTDATPLEAFHDDSIKFKIQKQVWRAICQAVESNDFPTLQYLICNESIHPQIATAVSHFRRIQSESRCVCEGDQSPENICHYSLGIPRYTQFTSPIRRYIDIVVHRLLIGLVLTSSTNYAVNLPTKDEVSKVCRRYTFIQDNARKFEKYCRRIHLATQLQQRCRETRVFIESIQHQSMCLQILNREDDLLATRNKRIALSHLNLLTVDEKKEIQGDEQSIILKWKIRKYVAPDLKRDTTESSTSIYSGIDEVIEIPLDVWVSVLDMIRANDKENLTTTIKEVKEKLSTVPSNRGKDTSAQTSFGHVHGIHYKHPHQNDEAQPSFEGTVDHFYEKKVTLRKYDFLSVQLCPHMIRGILEPDVQVFKVDVHLNICIEHRKHPRESFSHTARHQASRERYESIDEYVEAWKPVLAMEAATEAVKENDGFTIENLNVVWKHKADSARGEFKLPFSYCQSRQLNFYEGDLVCIRMSYSKTSPPSGESESHRKSSKDNLHSDSSGSASDFWVAHCIIKDVNFFKEKQKVKVIMYLHQSASTIPEGLFNEEGYRCTLELIHRTLPQRRMYAALCNLEHSSELVHAICRGEEPSKESYGELPTSLFLTQFGFKKLNTYQEAAVKEALCHPFTLIQGPPGTGKTVTGVHIAYWFAEQNKKKKSLKPLKKETSETECDGAHKSPPQVMYCGPSNKSVDVVTELLLKVPDLKVLRVYSDQVEQKEFPIPNKLKPARSTRSDDELKISSDQIRSVSLHHVIRGPECPFSEELRKYEEGFAQCKAMNETIGQKEVADYRKTIGLAEEWALQKSGVQIILCTCAASGSPRMVSSCDNIQQCIVDECGMCMEPESLVPITCSGAKQVVLIGDHKQLQPVIQDHVAKTLGLSVSMFERHSKRATMLELQYRMHDGICEFPSTQFYNKKLRTADVVKSRAPSPVSFWPAQVRRQRKLPIVFCHVEGQEESAPIATSESNEESKRNMKEVHKAVQIAKHLVNRYVAHVRKSDVVILSPYREQRSKITELLKGAYEDIKVTTITKSQGSEWDYVIISLVRSVNRDEIDPEPSPSWLREHLGFLTDEHQMNVGLTRARRGLCIIGNRYLLALDPAWKSLLEHYEKNGCLVNEDWPWP